MATRKPNILIIMVDQLNGTFFPDGPADFLHAPNLKALAARSARFVNNYTSSPLCAPARASFMAGQLPSRTRVYDNAAEYVSSIPTYAHHLRRAGPHRADHHRRIVGRIHQRQNRLAHERFVEPLELLDFRGLADKDDEQPLRRRLGQHVRQATAHVEILALDADGQRRQLAPQVGADGVAAPDQ